MFTGIVEELGTVTARRRARVRIGARRVLEGTAIGASVAVDGCCLTVVAIGDGWWEADVSDETYARTTLGDLAEGARVNLERPLALGDRLGGHLVLGHVDGVGEVLAPAPDLAVRMPPGMARLVVEKGSVAVDGVSLTAFDLRGDTFRVAVIPHTAAVTTLGARRPGDRVNLEADMLAKHVARLAEVPVGAPRGAGSWGSLRGAVQGWLRGGERR